MFSSAQPITERDLPNPRYYTVTATGCLVLTLGRAQQTTPRAQASSALETESPQSCPPGPILNQSNNYKTPSLSIPFVYFYFSRFSSDGSPSRITSLIHKSQHQTWTLRSRCSVDSLARKGLPGTERSASWPSRGTAPRGDPGRRRARPPRPTATVTWPLAGTRRHGYVRHRSRVPGKLMTDSRCSAVPGALLPPSPLSPPSGRTAAATSANLRCVIA